MNLLAQGGAPAKRQRVSNKLCDLFEMGGCTRGDNCPFAHFEHELIKPGDEPAPAKAGFAGGIPPARPQPQISEWGGGGGGKGDAFAQPWAPPQSMAGAGGMTGSNGWSPPTPAVDPTRYKLAVCEFFQEGRCLKGSSCTYAHGEHELRSPPSRVPPAGASQACGGMSKPGKPGKEPCWFHEKGWCTKGDACKFSHDFLPGAAATACSPAGASDDIQQAALLYQQAMGATGAQTDTTAAQSSAIVAASTAASASDETAAASLAGYDEQTIAALYQYQALQATLMAQTGCATEFGGDAGAGQMDAATAAAYSAAWAAALSGAGLLPSTASALTGASAGQDTTAAIAAAAAASAEYQQTLLLASLQLGGGQGLGTDAGTAAVKGIAATRANHKMELCKFYSDGKCVKGAFCPYAHGNEEVLAASLRSARVEAAMREGTRNDICYDFRDRGKCRFGITCKFSHNLSA